VTRDDETDPGTTHQFRPAAWLRGAHAQTIVGRALRAGAGSPCTRRERVELSDGDFVDLDVARPRTANSGDAVPWTLVLHGLEGSARSGYVRLTCTRLVERSIEAVALNFRGCGGQPNRRPRSYHSGQTEDVAAVVEHLRGSRPGVAHAIIGYSLGGNVLLKYLGEIGSAAHAPAAAVAVSVPFDLAASAAALERGLGRLYSRHFLRTMIPKALDRARRFPDGPVPDRIRRCRTLREFDEAVTAPVHGFASADDYYRRCSSIRFLGAVRVPTLLVQALDDPFVPVDSLPSAAAWENPALRPRFSEAGGHLGFVGRGGIAGGRFWAETVAADFVARHVATPVGREARESETGTATKEDE